MRMSRKPLLQSLFVEAELRWNWTLDCSQCERCEHCRRYKLVRWHRALLNLVVLQASAISCYLYLFWKMTRQEKFAACQLQSNDDLTSERLCCSCQVDCRSRCEDAPNSSQVDFAHLSPEAKHACAPLDWSLRLSLTADSKSLDPLLSYEVGRTLIVE